MPNGVVMFSSAPEIPSAAGCAAVAPVVELDNKRSFLCSTRRRPGSCARQSARGNAPRHSKTGHRRRVKGVSPRRFAKSHSVLLEFKDFLPVRSATFPSGVAPIPGSVEGARDRRTGRQTRELGPVQGGHDQARVLRGFEERGGERPDGTHARSRIFHPLAHPSLRSPNFLLRKQKKIIDGPGVEIPPLRTRAACPTSSTESAAAAGEARATLRRTPSSASSRKVRAPPATLSDAPRYLKKGSAAPHPHLAAVPPCHADLFSPSSLLRPDANFVLVRKATYAEFRYPTQPSCAARRFRARAAARASLGQSFSWLWHAEIHSRGCVRGAPQRGGGSPRASARMRRLTRHSPLSDAQDPPSSRATSEDARVSGALCLPPSPSRTLPRGAVILPSIVLFPSGLDSPATRLHARRPAPRRARDLTSFLPVSTKQSESRKRKYQSESEVSGCGAFL